MRLLVSVRAALEVESAVSGGADIIDAKEPLNGSLGPVTPRVLREILEEVPGDQEASAALGDFADLGTVRQSIQALPRVERTAPVYLKLGFGGVSSNRRIKDVIHAACTELDRRSHPVIAVAYADHERAGCPSPETLIDIAISAGAAGVLVDTQSKEHHLFHWIEPTPLRTLFRAAREAGLLTAAAGSLEPEHLETIRTIQPDIVGFRGAICEGGRQGLVSRERVSRIRRQLETSFGFYSALSGSASLGETHHQRANPCRFT
jgi:(5-formylfuran-3-yl)methyl phosphate synthase